MARPLGAPLFRFKAAQMQRLERSLTAQFAVELAAHAQQFAPAACDLMGPEALRQVVEQGMERARGHGFDCRGALRFFLELQLLLGSEFDTDPQYLALFERDLQPSADPQLERADRLHEILVAYIDAVSGPGHRLEAQAAQAALQWDYERLQALGTRAPAEWAQALAVAYPAKAQVIGANALQQLVEQAANRARRGDPQWREAGPLLAALMFTFGHACVRDPQFGWIPAALHGPHGEMPDAGLRRLHRRFMAFMQQTRDQLAAAAH